MGRTSPQRRDIEMPAHRSNSRSKASGVRNAIRWQQAVQNAAPNVFKSPIRLIDRPRPVGLIY